MLGIPIRENMEAEVGVVLASLQTLIPRLRGIKKILLFGGEVDVLLLGGRVKTIFDRDSVVAL